MKSFINYFKDYNLFNQFMYSLKGQLISFTIKFSQFKIIKRRISFYYNCKKDDEIPPEPWYERIVRMFTGCPSPYYYDYSIPNPNQHTLDEVIFEIKQYYGYSSRASSLISFSRSSYLSHSGYMYTPIGTDKMSKRRIYINKSLSAKGFVNPPVVGSRSRGDSLSLIQNTPNLHSRKVQIAPSMEDSNQLFQ